MPMPMPTIMIPGLRPIDDAAAAPWLERAAELALAFSREVHGEQPQSHARDVVAIHLAATVLWRATEGRPCWSKLDPEVLNDHLASVPAWQVQRLDFCVTYHAFFCFLAKHGHLSPDAAHRAQERFVPWVRPVFERLLRAIEASQVTSRAHRRRAARATARL